ncbi:MAG TPA: hypothetical protein VIP11_01860 [Gemmatimonadaceae bacterium]
MTQRPPATTQIPALVRRQAVCLIADARAAMRQHGFDARILHCLIAAPDGDESGWSWWIVGASGEARPATPALLAAVDGNRMSSVWGWWCRFHAQGPCGRFGGARTIIAEFTIDAPIRDYPTGPNGDLNTGISLLAGITPAVVTWGLGSRSPDGWPA